MEDKDSIRKELEELSPLLAKMKATQKEEGFQVPPQYFKSLEQELLEIAKNQESKEQTKPVFHWLERLSDLANLIFQPRFAVGLATFTLLVLGGYFATNLMTSSNPGLVAESEISLTKEEITNYVLNNIEDFDTDLLLEVFGNDINMEFLPMEEYENQEIENVFEELLEEVDIDELENLL